MSLTRLMILVILSATSALGNFPLAYSGLQAPLLPLSQNLQYISGGSDGFDLSGFSYFGKDFNAGKSGVAFFAGPDSQTNFNNEVFAFRDQLGAAPAKQETKPDGKQDKVPEISSLANGDASTATTVAPVVPVESNESEATPKPDTEVDATTVTPEIKDADSKDPEVVVALINGQILAGSGAGFGAPYPILRFGGSASYYPDLSTPFSRFPGYSGYEPSDYFRPQYQPYNSYFSSYQSVNSPFYPSLDGGDFYNPTFPLVDQHPFSSQVPTVIPDIFRRFKNGEAGAAEDSEKVEPKAEDRTESPISTTEETVQKSDATTSEASPAVASDSKEETTTIADSAAVP